MAAHGIKREIVLVVSPSWGDRGYHFLTGDTRGNGDRA